MSGWQHSFITEINGYVSRRWPSTGESRHTHTHTCVCTHPHACACTHTGLGNAYNKSPGHIVYPVSLYIYLSIHTYIYIYIYIYRERERERDKQIDFKKQVHIILGIW